MPCTNNCVNRNRLVQNRIKCSWYNMTITMMQNIIDLCRSIHEAPWLNNSTEITREKIEMCNRHRIATVQQILQLETIIREGCQWCVQLQTQKNAWRTRSKSIFVCFYKNRVFQHIFFIIYDMLIFGYSFMKKRIVKLLFSMIVPRTTDMIIKRLYITYDYWTVTTNKQHYIYVTT